MSPSLISVISFESKIVKNIFTKVHILEINEIIGMLNKGSPIFIAKMALIKRNLNKMIPAETDKFLKIDFVC
jgi:hypothetical protein